MTQDELPKVDSINITPVDKNELDWTSTIMYLINQSEDGSVDAPCKNYPELERTMKYIVGSFIHEN